MTQMTLRSRLINGFCWQARLMPWLFSLPANMVKNKQDAAAYYAKIAPFFHNDMGTSAVRQMFARLETRQ